ncbi:SpoIIE family protein phosphatase [Kitasatospora viridis]|uniref:protein-serine/threonine phosphatase n=1 Tax=Kitasatospora viridis TaxID=281105 RepID=A0A561T6R1_9ACTN|nr:SpoIIE family protein phosphatase [Kitasatospora viridis]TWF82782.1 histidine kinase-like protein [Kitasatospora viridis]
MRSLLSVRSLAGRIFLIELLIVLVLVASAVATLVVQARSSAENDARRVTQSVAATFANTSGVAQALQGPNPTAVLQPQATAVELATGVDSVVVFNTDFIQLTSPYPGYVGKPYAPPANVKDKVVPQLRAGKTVTFTVSEPGYQSIATAVPIFAANGTPEGVVAVNIGVAKVNSVVGSNLPAVLGSAAAALLLAAFGTAFAARRLARETRGLGPTELARMYDHHSAVLHAVREGVLIISEDGRLLLANDEARRLLDLPADAEQRSVAELGLDAGTVALLLGSDDEVTDAIHPAGDRLLAVNRRPTAPYGGLPSNVVTLRDSTELHELAGRVEAADRRSRLLHEAGMRIGRTLDMTRTCEELAELVVPGFADGVTVDLLDEVARGEEPSGADWQLRRMAARGTPADGGSEIGGSEIGGSEIGGSEIGVPLRVRGTALGVVEFRRAPGRAEFEPDDRVLAEELAARAAVSIDNARRYTREHGLAVALQHSLLPRLLPERTALELAYRYLPAHAGVGGDWFDAIPLPGLRTALVVGDVVGHGISAAVAMGRLRTSIRNFAALDLPPDEVLGRLDELVAQLDEEGAGPEISGSTCVYAVYDPVSGDCVVSLAGHPRPALLAPDGEVSFPVVGVSPPLGIGGHPFESTVLRLTPGSSLVLFTDGLVENRSEDIDVGLERLRTVLAEQAGRGPEELCEAVTRSALVERPADDVALLVARTTVLAADRVAEWQVASDPAAVAPVRAEAAERLAEWGLAELGFATELILSELVTNAIRYGTSPVRVRLLHDTSLVCEVSDGSSTAPHLRWAKTTDEGGRGLFLVAQLAHRWGTRYTAQGKVIWCEQLLPE